MFDRQLEARVESEINRLSDPEVAALFERADQRLCEGDVSEELWLKLRVLWERKLAVRLRDFDAVLEVARWIRSRGVATEWALRLANRVAWLTRGESYVPEPFEWEELLPCEGEKAAPEELFSLCVYGYRPRFLLQFKKVEQVLQSVPLDRGVVRESPWFLGLRAFSLLGRKQYDPGIVRVVCADLRRARAAVKGQEGEGDLLDLVLHAVDAAQAPASDGLPELAIELHGDDQDQQPQPVILFRLGKAHGRLANRSENTIENANEQRALALKRFNDCLNTLSGDREFTRFFAEQVRQERDAFIRGVQLTLQWLQSREEMVEVERRIRFEAQSGTVRSTEVLALFSSAVAFAVGAAAIGANAETAQAAVATGLLLMLGLLGFATALIFASRMTTSHIANLGQTGGASSSWATVDRSARESSVAELKDQNGRLARQVSRAHWLSGTAILFSLMSLMFAALVPFF